MNYNDYKITSKDDVFRTDNKGKLLILKPTIGKHVPLSVLRECNLPDLNYNKYFFRPKTYNVSKVLHETSDLVIIDYKEMFTEEMKQGTIEQYIGDGVIITELTYSAKETYQEYLKRVLKDLESSRKVYSIYKQRFYLESLKDELSEAEYYNHQIEFTQLVKDNIELVIEYIKAELI